MIRISSAFLVLVLSSAGFYLWAEGGGSVSGSVKDARGGVISGASIILRNVATGIERTSTTNSIGFYAFTAVPVGHYEIEAKRSGFKPYKRTGLLLGLGFDAAGGPALEFGRGVRPGDGSGYGRAH
jgi:hypothetical protein